MTGQMVDEVNQMSTRIEAALIQAVRRAVLNTVNAAVKQRFDNEERKTASDVQSQAQNSMQNNAISEQNSADAARIRAAVQSAVRRAIRLAFERRNQLEQQAARIAIQQVRVQGDLQPLNTC